MLSKGARKEGIGLLRAMVAEMKALREGSDIMERYELFRSLRYWQKEKDWYQEPSESIG
jgi:hypothetical protein